MNYFTSEEVNTSQVTESNQQTQKKTFQSTELQKEVGQIFLPE